MGRSHPRCHLGQAGHVEPVQLRRVRAQLALEDSRARYVDLYEFAPVGYLTLTGEAVISEVNLTGARLLREERKKILGKRFARFVSREDSDRYHRLFVSVMQRDERQACELALRRSDGSVLHAQVDCLRVPAGDKPPRVRITLTDISERKRAEAELRVAATAFESQEGMFVADAGTVILRINRAFIDITGFTAATTRPSTPRSGRPPIARGHGGGRCGAGERAARCIPNG